MSAKKTTHQLTDQVFEQLFKDHFKGFCYFALRFVKDMEIARELVQESFVVLWEKRSNIDMSKPVKSYISTTLHNKCLNYLRDNKKFNRDLIETEQLPIDSGGADSMAGLIVSELDEQIKAAVSSLPDRCREVFVLSRFENLKYSEIAKKLNISQKTVEAQMSKALQILREKLAEWLPLVLLLFYFFKNR